ncbi:helix-turn-helix domain-containing protein [Streptosporangium sp. NPDC000396]
MALHKAGEHTSTELAELFGVARSTVYWAVERAAGGQEAAKS